MEQLDYKQIQRISFWGIFVGVITIIYGIFLTFQGFFASIIGALPGLVTIVIGYHIFKTGQEAKIATYSGGNDVPSLNRVFANYAMILIITGVISVIVILFYILFFLFI